MVGLAREERFMIYVGTTESLECLLFILVSALAETRVILLLSCRCFLQHFNTVVLTEVLHKYTHVHTASHNVFSLRGKKTLSHSQSRGTFSKMKLVGILLLTGI